MSRNYTHEEREEIQKRLTELVRKNGRMTFGELRRVGYMTVTPDTKGNPQSGDVAFGMVQTLDSLGAGNDGQKVIPAVGAAKEWITQILFMADGSLYTRARVNNNGFQPFVKRW
ncbi:DUF977 family protein [Salmonella enterica]|nr:DUF977 family protein [Salmonella enterica]